MHQSTVFFHITFFKGGVVEGAITYSYRWRYPALPLSKALRTLSKAANKLSKCEKRRANQITISQRDSILQLRAYQLLTELVFHTTFFFPLLFPFLLHFPISSFVYNLRLTTEDLMHRFSSLPPSRALLYLSAFYSVSLSFFSCDSLTVFYLFPFASSSFPPH